MNKPLLGRKMAVLVANGFNEKDLTLTQKAMMHSGVNLRIVSMDSGLVNSWDDVSNGWGLNFASDQALNQALAADFDMLTIPGGQRSADKLELTAHTRRFIGGFVDTHKPVVAVGEALQLMIFAERAKDMDVTGPESLRERAEAAGAVWSDDMIVYNEHVMMAQNNDAERQAIADAANAFFVKSMHNAPQDETMAA